MPIVTVNPNESEKFELKSAPANPNDPEDENGYVLLRPLPYGMKLTRRDKATKMSMKSQPTKGKGRGSDSDNTIELASYNEWAVFFDFSYCIVGHNLQNADGTPVDFTKQMSLKMLDPKVGSEIERLINSLNEDEDEETIEDFLTRSSTSSPEEADLSESEKENLSETGTKLVGIPTA